MKYTSEERKNKIIIESIITSVCKDNIEYDNLSYQIQPYGCSIEISCNDIQTLIFLDSHITKELIKNIRGAVRITYNNFIKGL